MHEILRMVYTVMTLIILFGAMAWATLAPFVTRWRYAHMREPVRAEGRYYRYRLVGQEIGAISLIAADLGLWSDLFRYIPFPASAVLVALGIIGLAGSILLMISAERFRTQ